MKLGKLYICDGYYYLPTMTGLTFFDANGDHIASWIVSVSEATRVAVIFGVLFRTSFASIAEEWKQLVRKKYEVALYTVREDFL